ncbi:flavodoxin [Collinsella sp. zg1085]|uniref:flavodoxin n=1 Tax=Collinsella sp. zg1085 TaxID=2844380 RepID=UPI001C0BE5ED|nr:flavodoxin [Collinsella sp. zg1085]QWT18170.1 flavodoxin [Collinsella sp. zg1085]
MSKVAVIFWSGTGNTEALAGFIGDGVAEAGGEAEVIQVSDFDTSSLDAYDAFALGCPAMGSEELEYDEFEPFWNEVKGELGDKKVALFGSYEWADGEWMDTWKADAADAGVNVVDTLICYDAPDAEAEAGAKTLATKLV